MKKPVAENTRYRVEVWDGDREVLSGWATVKGLEYTLDMAYPDAMPAVGMMLSSRRGRFEIASVNGRWLKAREVS